jgi:bacillithiol system protein YtxJ
MQAIRKIDSEQALDAAFQSPIAVLYKHSAVCGIARAAYGEVDRFAGEHPTVPVFLIDVRAQRDLSRRTAEHFGIRHESPQVIVIKNGKAVWHGSHWTITAEALEKTTTNER